MQQLIIPNEAKAMARGISKHVTDDKVNIYIEESENIDIKRALGDAMFLDVKLNPDTEANAILLCGGEYLDRHGCTRYFNGLKKALSYYVYARLMKNGDYNVDRFGTSTKNSEYSSSTVYKEKVTAYNDAFSVADIYLKECVLYLKENVERYPLYRGMGKLKSNRTKFKVIGE